MSQIQQEIEDSKTELLNKRRLIIMRHIDGVRLNCQKLAERLIENGEIDLGHRLIANGYCHDQSKFHGSEWLHLNEEVKKSDPKLFEAALIQHRSTNLHHPEAWEGGVHAMDRLHRAEMVCDCAARSGEFCTDLRVFFREKLTKRFDMSTNSKAYREFKEMMDLLLDPKFS